MNTSALDSGRKWNFSCTEPKAKEQTAWAKSIQFSFINTRYIFGDPGAVIRVGRNRRDESIPFLPTRLTPPGSTKMPALLTGQANVQFDVSHVCQMEQTDPNSAFLICNYLCSVEFQRSHLKVLLTRNRTFLKPCIFLPGFVWTWFNKPLDVAIESGCKKIVFGEQIHWFPPMEQRTDFGGRIKLRFQKCLDSFGRGITPFLSTFLFLFLFLIFYVT